MGKSAKNTCQHTRAIQLDRQRHRSTPPDAAVEQRLNDLIHPATFAQVAHFHACGLRERTLTLPVMMAFVLSLIWRQLGSVSQAVRLLADEGFLWSSSIQVSQQSLSERLRKMPAALFEAVLTDLLPRVQERWHHRSRRLKPVLAWASERFEQILIADASTLDAVVKKVGLLRGSPGTALGGKIVALLDVLSQQPRALWYDSEAPVSEQRFWDRLIASIASDALLLIDMGFSNYERFAELSHKKIWFITRVKRDTAIKELRVLQQCNGLRDVIIELGRDKHRIDEPMRLVELTYRGVCYRYLTNLLDSERLPAPQLAALYRERWRIEDVFLIVKRLLGLAYFYSGSSNAVQLQLWATWILYVVLLDLADEIGERLQCPINDLSLEMLYRSLYHYTQAYHQGRSDDPIEYLSTHAVRLGIIKRKRRTTRIHDRLSP